MPLLSFASLFNSPITDYLLFTIYFWLLGKKSGKDIEADTGNIKLNEICPTRRYQTIAVRKEVWLRTGWEQRQCGGEELTRQKIASISCLTSLSLRNKYFLKFKVKVNVLATRWRVQQIPVSKLSSLTEPCKVYQILTEIMYDNLMSLNKTQQVKRKWSF